MSTSNENYEEIRKLLDFKPSTVNERFKEARKWLGFNQKDFASEIGISQTHVSGIENGKDNPSASLLKLISIKFNINEEWLTGGVGSPERGWSITTDEGILDKYNAMRVSFEQMLRERTGTELLSSIEAFSHLVSLLSANGLSDESRAPYLVTVCESISLIEALESSTHSLGLFSNHGQLGKNSYRLQLHYKTEAEKKMDLIDQKIREMNNIYLRQLSSETEL